jgi:small subunit ribosomal protein S18
MSLASSLLLRRSATALAVPGALRRGAAPALLTRLCSSAPPPKKGWDAASAIHGIHPEEEAASKRAAEAASKDAGASSSSSSSGTSRAQNRGPPSGGGFRGAGGAGGYAAGRYAASALSGSERANLMQFQAYVHQRLSELSQRLPPRPTTREQAELAFLEDEVIQDHMPRRNRRIRDPLRDVPLSDISHTNLNLLNRFVSDAGSILPRKLTGVTPAKQRKLTKSIKRAQELALMPKTWKLPKYRHASYADQYSLPERPPPPRSEDDEFRDPPDIRYPNQWDKARHSSLNRDVSKLIRLKLAPRGTDTS